MEKFSYFKIGIFVISAVVIGIIGVVVLGVGTIFQKKSIVETYIDESVQGLDVGSPLKFRGVPVGRVEQISLTSAEYATRREYVVVRMRRRHPIRTADEIKQSSEPALAIVDGCAALGAFGERDGFRAVTLANFNNVPGNVIEGFFPRDALPSRIRSAFGAGASEWIIEPVLIVDQLRRGFTFDAYHAAVGMIVIGVEARNATVLDGRDGCAVRRAQRAVAADGTGG